MWRNFFGAKKNQKKGKITKSRLGELHVAGYFEKIKGTTMKTAHNKLNSYDVATTIWQQSRSRQIKSRQT